jgi:hypothetical protein
MAPGRRRAARIAAALLGVGAVLFAALAVVVGAALPAAGLAAWLSGTPLLAVGGLAVSAVLQGYGCWHLFTRGGAPRCAACERSAVA